MSMNLCMLSLTCLTHVLALSLNSILFPEHILDYSLNWVLLSTFQISLNFLYQGVSPLYIFVVVITPHPKILIFRESGSEGKRERDQCERYTLISCFLHMT